MRPGKAPAVEALVRVVVPRKAQVLGENPQVLTPRQWPLSGSTIKLIQVQD
jgi:hypothetical protein